MDQSLISLIISVLLGIIVIIVGSWFRVLLNRNYDNVRDAIRKLDTKCEDLFQSDHTSGTEIVRMQEVLKFFESYKTQLSQIEHLRSEFLEKFTRRGDFIREMQAIASQMDAIYKKIDRMDSKIDERLLKG